KSGEGVGHPRRRLGGSWLHRRRRPRPLPWTGAARARLLGGRSAVGEGVRGSRSNKSAAARFFVRRVRSAKLTRRLKLLLAAAVIAAILMLAFWIWLAPGIFEEGLNSNGRPLSPVGRVLHEIGL